MRLAGSVCRSAIFALAMWAVPLGDSASAATSDEPVALGEVSSAVPRADVDFGPVLRESAVSELRGLDLSAVSRKERSIVSLALVRMDTRPTSTGLSTTCVVSATLRTARGGAIFAILEGRARAENAASRRRSLEENALKGAVHGALGGLRDALR